MFQILVGWAEGKEQEEMGEEKWGKGKKKRLLKYFLVQTL